MPFNKKEYNKQYFKEYYEKNGEKLKESKKKYRQTPGGIKSVRISIWKFRGLQCNYIEELYQHYLLSDQCENCMCILTEGSKKTSTTKCMDHSHITGEFRNILCNSCNVKRK